MAVSHVQHHDGLGGPALDREFVDHILAPGWSRAEGRSSIQELGQQNFSCRRRVDLAQLRTRVMRRVLLAPLSSTVIPCERCQRAVCFVTLITDACATHTQERHEASLHNNRGYCRQITTEELVAEVERLAVG